MAGSKKNKPLRNLIFCIIGLILNLGIIAAVVVCYQSSSTFYATDILAAANEVKLPKTAIFTNTSERYISGHASNKAYVVLRKTPSASAKEVTRLSNGTPIVIRSKKNKDGWYYITADLYSGWVKSSSLYKNFKDKSNNFKPDKTYNFAKRVIRIDSSTERMSLLMRSGPSKDYEFIRRAPNGAIVNLVGTSSKHPGWSYIEYRGTCGWVVNDSLYSVGSKTKYQTPVEPTYTSKTKATIKNSNKNQSIKVRIGPSSDYVFTDYVYSGNKVTILGSKVVKDVKWYCIEFSSPYSNGYYKETGWIQSQYVKKS